MNGIEILPLSQNVLSLVGMIVIISWLWKWLGKYTNKQKELSDLDKDIREAYKDLIGSQKELRYSDHELHDREITNIQNDVKQLKNELESTGTALVKYEKLIADIHKFNQDFTINRANEFDKENQKKYFSFLALVASKYKLSPDELLQRLKKINGEYNETSDFIDGILWFSNSWLSIVTRAAEALRITTYILPAHEAKNALGIKKRIGKRKK